MKNILSVAAVGALFFCIGWLFGADRVLFECRTVGATQFLGQTFMCDEVKP